MREVQYRPEIRRLEERMGLFRKKLRANTSDTLAKLPGRWIDKSDFRIEPSGVMFELRHRNDDHPPGCRMVLPYGRNVFLSAEIVYVDRMLTAQHVSDAKAWHSNFESIEKLQPTWIDSGCVQMIARTATGAQTRDYLIALRKQMSDAVAKGLELADAVKSSGMEALTALPLSAYLMPGSANHVYLELERQKEPSKRNSR